MFWLVGCNLSTNRDSHPDPNIEIPELLKQIFQLPSFQEYMHWEIASRKKSFAILSNDYVPSTLNLSIQGHQIPIVSRRELRQADMKNILIIQNVHVDQKTASIVIKYPLEGITLTSSFVRQDNNWIIAKTSIVEH